MRFFQYRKLMLSGPNVIERPKTKGEAFPMSNTFVIRRQCHPRPTTFEVFSTENILSGNNLIGRQKSEDFSCRKRMLWSVNIIGGRKSLKSFMLKTFYRAATLSGGQIVRSCSCRQLVLSGGNVLGGRKRLKSSLLKNFV